MGYTHRHLKKKSRRKKKKREVTHTRTHTEFVERADKRTSLKKIKRKFKRKQKQQKKHFVKIFLEPSLVLWIRISVHLKRFRVNEKKKKKENILSRIHEMMPRKVTRNNRVSATSASESFTTHE